jgi:hypothetical protein
MFSKFSRLLACFLAFAFVAAMAPGLKAQSSVDLDNISHEDLLKEGPLTQRDIEVYLSFFDANFKFFSENPEFQESDFEAFMTDFLAKNEVTPARLKYCALKVPQALMLISVGEKALEGMPEDMRLPISDADKELVEKNKDKIAAAIDKNKTSQ